MSGILDNLGILSENPSELFSLEAHDFIMDSVSTTYKRENLFSFNTMSSYLGAIGETDDAESKVSGMPVAGTIIGVVWMISRNLSVPTNTVNILINGVEVGSAVLVVGASETGWLKSEPLSIPFVVGDRIQFEVVRSGSTNGGIRGVFGMALNYS
jgi:hypothetical protein